MGRIAICNRSPHGLAIQSFKDKESCLAVTGFRFLLFSVVCTGLRAQAPDLTFFEAKIRPY